MATHIITITYQECATIYGLPEQDVREFVELGLLQPAPDLPDAIYDEPDHMTRLARLQQELGLSTSGIEVVLAMRQRLQQLQQEVAHQRARAQQLEHYVYHTGIVVEGNDWLSGRP